MRASFKVHLVLALTLCGLAVLIVAATFLPGAPLVPDPVSVTLFALVFPVFGTALIRCTLADRAIGLPGPQGHRFLEILRETPRPLQIASGVILVGALLSFVLGVGMLKGQPSSDGSSYHANNHGTHIGLTLDEYHQHVKAQERMFASGCAHFYMGSAIFVLAASRSRERASRGVPPYGSAVQLPLRPSPTGNVRWTRADQPRKPHRAPRP
ncbi:hypothetical protein QMZ92_30385 [Streptomyces sp. HNM0645]|uniref:hypothetical protein n=1 Tax=Streptomyces sp. HNM0645 TaxID=2782343 RepID=UPI0024B6BEEE|nr:hypothetical protein [Streptomyces sp. HNM0645]MDI9888561.1 hypothetical protein [Streptomyces sp. HNM0645]